MPASVLRKVQLAAQAAWGTSNTTATVQLTGVTDVSLDIVPDVYMPQFMGTLAPAITAGLMGQHGEASITQVASYQDLPYYLQGVFGTSAASAGANTTYVYKYEAKVDQVTTAPYYTVQIGTTDAEYALRTGMFTNLTISGEAGGMWEVSADLLGAAVTTMAMTTGLDVRDVDLIRMADTNIYVTPWAQSTLTTTALSATLISFELTANPQRHLKTFAGSGNPAAYGDSTWEGQLTTVLEFNSNAKTFVDEMVSPDTLVQRQIRLRASTGSATEARQATIDFAGTLADNVTLWDERDGNMTVSLVWNGTYNTANTSWLKLDVKNELSSVV
jgi:hypothetical protein